MSLTDYQIDVLKRATNILTKLAKENNQKFTDVGSSKDFFHHKLAGLGREVFSVLYLNNQHEYITYEELFKGTINSCSVYPREIIKRALELNAAAIILGHVHPSGCVKASNQDIVITGRIKEVCDILDISLLDHIIVGRNPVSMAEKGVLP